MAGEVKTAAEALETALAAVEGLRVFRDPGGAIDPPAAIVMPPALTWDAVCLEPTGARFPVHVVEEAGERANERLWQQVQLIAEALDQVTDASVVRADPGTWTSSQELPAYTITVEYAL